MNLAHPVPWHLSGNIGHPLTHCILWEEYHCYFWKNKRLRLVKMNDNEKPSTRHQQPRTKRGGKMKLE